VKKGRDRCRFCLGRPRKKWKNAACRDCWAALKWQREVANAEMRERVGMANGGRSVPGQAERVERYRAVVAAGGRLFE
jgi:hypothetical protein